MANKEVEINGKIIGENTKITMNLSTIAWTLGILLSVITTLATIGYFDIKSDGKDMKSIFEKEKIEYKEDIKEMIQKELRYDREKREDIIEDIGEIKGDIKVILEKTRNLEGGHSGHNHNTGFSAPDTTSRPPSR